MASAWTYGWRNLRYRTNNWLLLFGQSITLSSSIFTFLLVLNFASSLIKYEDRIVINSTLSNRYAAFGIIIGICLFLGAIIFFFMLLRTILQTKSRDIALMVALGGLKEKINDRLLAEAVIMAFFSAALSIFCGNIIFYVTSIILSIAGANLLVSVSFIASFSFSVFISAIFFIIAYIMASIIVIRSTKNYYAAILSEEINSNVKISKWANIFIPSINKDKILTKLARINFFRTLNLVRSHFFTFLILASILSATVFGTISVKDSTIKAMNQGVGSNHLFMIGNPEVKDFFESSYELFAPLPNSIDLARYTFSGSQITALLKDSGVSESNIELKLLIQSPVTSIINRPISDQSFQSSTKTGNAFIVGQSMTNTFANWQYFGQKPNNLKNGEIAVGESTAWNILDKPFENKEQIEVNDSNIDLTVKSIIVDPFLKGKTVYLPLNLMQSIFHINGDQRNFGLVKIDSDTVVETVKQNLSNLSVSLDLIPLDPIIRKNVQFQEYLGFILIILVLPTILSYIVAIVTYIMTILDIRKDTLQILKSLGSPRKKLESSIKIEIWGILFWAIIIGSLLGIIFIIGFVIPEAVISPLGITIFLGLIFIIFISVRYYIKVFIEKSYEESIY